MHVVWRLLELDFAALQCRSTQTATLAVYNQSIVLRISDIFQNGRQRLTGKDISSSHTAVFEDTIVEQSVCSLFVDAQERGLFLYPLERGIRLCKPNMGC